MKRLWAAAGLLAFLLTGCTERLAELPELAFLFPTEATEAETTAEAEPTDAGVLQDAVQTVTFPTEATTSPHSLYFQTLTDLHDRAILPSGNTLETDGDIEKNRFAVYDIDGDGREELILEITQTALENRFTAVYDVDADGDLRRELRYEAVVTFWTRGFVTASYPDAAEHEGDFIPYAAAQYDAEQDAYPEFAYVSAIDRSRLAAQDLLDEYPESADKSKSGRVYCIYGDNPVDVTEYDSWYAAWHTGLRELDVPYQELTIDHLHSLEE